MRETLSAGGPVTSQTWHPFPQTEAINFQPRFGFNYSFNENTELRGGAGLFSDLYPAGFVDGVIQNFPNYNSETAYDGSIATGGTGTTGAFVAAANTAVQSGFANGGSLQSINTALAAQGVPFTPPSYNAYFPSTFRVPEYLEYSLQLQRQITRTDALILTYAGNYGYNEVLINPLQNAGDGTFDNATGAWETSLAGQFSSFSATPADPRFSHISAYTNAAHSNYNGGMITWKHHGHGFTGQGSYTYSHSLDMVSNGGEGESWNGGSISAQLTPTLGAGNLNYSNSDYDIRHNIVGDLVYDEPFKSKNLVLNALAGGWEFGTKTYWRTGEPFSIVDGSIGGNYPNLGGVALTPSLAPGVTVKQLTNHTIGNPHSCADTGSCLDVSQFVAPTSGFGTLRRNSLYGPHYVNTDLSLLKKIVKGEGVTFQIGANAYNVFNRVNFANPANDISVGNFGEIGGADAPPTSPYGSFQGAAVTQRLLQVHGRITF